MATQYDAYTEDYDDSEDYTATDTVRHKAWGALIFGLCLLPTPFAPLGVLMVVAGVALIAITPKLQTMEDTSQDGWQDEIDKGRSGCGWVVWFCFWGALLIIGAGAVAMVVAMAVMGKGGGL